MPVDRRSFFRWSRFIAVGLAASAICALLVELLAPERRFGTAQVAAEVAVLVVPRQAPTAETVRRRVLSTENLRAVAARLKGEKFDASAPADPAEAATFERWRRALIVEVRTTADAQRRRIRFVCAAAGSPSEAAALVDTVAAQYAGDLAAARWYAAVDCLRAAEQKADDNLKTLLDLVRGGANVPTSSPKPTEDRVGRSPRTLPNIAAQPLAVSQNSAAQLEADRELLRLTQLRATLLETLQPAHPQVVAIDNRLTTLQIAGAGTSIRRLSAEEQLSLALPEFPAAKSEAVPEGFTSAQAEALQRYRESHAAVQTCLDDMLTPAAAEFPVVSTVVVGLHLWELRPFWHMSAVVLGLTLGAIAAWPRRTVVPVVEVPATATAVRVATASSRAERPLPQNETVRPVAPASVREAPPSDEVLIQTVEQALDAAGGQVLGVLVRRREPALR